MPNSGFTDFSNDGGYGTKQYDTELFKVLTSISVSEPTAMWNSNFQRQQFRNNLQFQGLLIPVECVKPWFFDNHPVTFTTYQGPYSFYTTVLKAGVRVVLKFPAHNLSTVLDLHATLEVQDKYLKDGSVDYMEAKLRAALAGRVEENFLQLRDKGFIRLFDPCSLSVAPDMIVITLI
jgi:hypothetical protein